MTESSYPLKKICSFVRRQGRLTKGQLRALEELWPQFGLSLEAGRLDANKVFNNSGHLIVEIGFGHGQALIQQAIEQPQQNYIGIEVHKPGVGALLLGIEKHELKNIRIYHDDAVEVLSQCIADNSLARVHIFFPDPWHKLRHHKRRLIRPDFIELIQKKLMIGGVLHLATDWQDYAEHMMKVLSDADRLDNIAGASEFSPRPDTRPLTKFEQRGLRLGHGVWDLLFVKKI